MAITAAEVWRDYETDGVPSSGPHKVRKPDSRQWGAWVEGIISAFINTDGGKIFTSKATLDASLNYAANTMAWVIGDATVANSGVYMKVGGSGSGSWTRVSDLPFSFIIASDAGAGTPNAIQATTSIPVSSSALVWMNVFEANTASPVTVSFNGGAPLTIKTNTGNKIATGGLVAGMIVLGIVSGATFRLVSDQASSAIVAAAEAAQAAAEAAATSAAASAAAAAASAAGVSLPPVAPNRMLVDNASGTARESKTFSEVIALLGLDARYLRLSARGYVDLSTDFGAPGAGSDYTAQWSSLLDACIGGMKGLVPQGTFNVTAPSTKTFSSPFQSIRIEGAGPQTRLHFLGELGGALTLNYSGPYNSFNISDMVVGTNSNSTAMSAFRLLSPAFGNPAGAAYNRFRNIEFRGVDGVHVSNHWGNCVYSHRTSNIFFTQCRFLGPGSAIGDALGRGNLVELQSQSGDYAVKYDFDGCYFAQFGNAILAGTYVQGISMRGSDFVGGRSAVTVPAGQDANDGLLATNCHFNTREAAIEQLSTTATSLRLSNNFWVIDKPNQVGVKTAGYRFGIVNNHFEGISNPSGAIGVLAVNGAKQGTLVGNSFGFLPVGVQLDSGTSFIKCNDSTFDNVATPTINNGTSNTIGAASA